MTSYQRAMALVISSSLLVPVIGLASAPILTHALGVAGRGEVGAALAPNLLIVGAATLGLPQALTYHLAKHPAVSRTALGWASLFTLLLGGLAVLAVFLARPYLSGGDPTLAGLMTFATCLALPALVVGLLRGAAAGRQMWAAVALERLVNSVVRLCLLGGLALLGQLDVTNAVLVMCLTPVLAGITYVHLAARPPVVVIDIPSTPNQVAPALLTFGFQTWLGSVATELLARMGQLLVTPLSNVEQLGLLLVAIYISDVPYIVTQTVRDVSFGANSAVSDTARLLATSRVATLLTVVGATVMGATLPLWIGFVFGSGFSAAVVPTWLLLGAACVAVPGLIAGAGLDSAGRPGRRSVALGIALVVNLVGLVAFVPTLGAVGAALAALVSTVVFAGFAMVTASRTLHSAVHRFVVLERSDLALLRSTVHSVLRRLRSVPSASGPRRR